MPSANADNVVDEPPIAPPPPHAASVPPIRAVSSRRFGLIWLLVLAGFAAFYPLAALAWVNFYRSPDIAFAELVYRQKDVLCQRQPSPRLLIVGGSGVHFSIDAALIEARLGIPSINYGSYAGLGFRYMLQRAQRQAHRGDTVLLSPEYSCWGRDAEHSNDPGFEYIWTYDQRAFYERPLLERASMIASIRLVDWVDAAKGWGARLRGKQYHFADIMLYNVASDDEHGDVHVVLRPHNIPRQTGYGFPEQSMVSVTALRDFAAWAKANGVRVLFTWPAFARPQPTVSKEASAPPGWFTDLLRDGGVTMLDQPADNTYPPQWFQDTEYHVTPACRRLRTEELLRRLRPALNLPARPMGNDVLIVGPRDHHLNPGNTFATGPEVSVRILSDPAVEDARAITPAGALDLARGGTNVYVGHDDAVAAGLSTQLSAHERMSIAEWFHRYPSHVLLIAAAPGHRIDTSWQSAVPPAVYQALSSGSPTVAAFGTGRYAGTLKIVADATVAKLPAKLPALVKPASALIALVSLESSASGAKINLDYGDIRTSDHGVCVAAVDPELGSAIDMATFTDAPDVETWRLDRVVPGVATPTTR
ncbi:MAG TPA: hypothetical protein VLI90_11810 [Tepidisphaeraceae bacterium]|nr:hypothetical protein [Tepidisphaeraceae bacterium]